MLFTSYCWCHFERSCITVWLNPASVIRYNFTPFSEARQPPQPSFSLSCFDILCFCCSILTSWCFTNSWYTLPFPFLLFCWQKLHWWKLTCKVDSFVCLIQSLISLPSLHLQCPPLPNRSTVSTPTLFTSPSARWLHSLNSPSCHMGFSPIGIQVSLPSCIKVYGAHALIWTHKLCVVFIWHDFLLSFFLCFVFFPNFVCPYSIC